MQDFMITTVEKWGNSFAIRLPRSIIEQLNWPQKTQIQQSVIEGKLVVEAVSRPKYTLEKLLAELTEENMQGEADIGLLWSEKSGSEKSKCPR